MIKVKVVHALAILMRNAPSNLFLLVLVNRWVQFEKKSARFRLMCLNIDSVLGHVDQLRILLDQEKPHIMCLNETKLDLSISDSLVNVDNYQIIRNDRDRHGGGVAAYVHESISYKIRSDLMPDKLEVVTLQIANSKFKPFIVASISRPLGKPFSYFNDMEALLASLDSDNKEAIIMGDTNCNFLDSSNNDTKNLKRVLSLHDLTQIIKEPTRITRMSQTLIDHGITNKPDMVHDSGVISCGISDHDVVFIERNVRAPKIKLDMVHDSGVISCGISDHDIVFIERNVRAPKIKAPAKVLNVRNFKRFDNDSFRNNIQKIPMDQIRSFSGDVNTMWHWWKTFFLDVLNKHAPITKI